MKRRKRKSDQREVAQFVWTLLVGVAAAVAALHQSSVIRDPASTPARPPAAELLDTRAASK